MVRKYCVSDFLFCKSKFPLFIGKIRYFQKLMTSVNQMLLSKAYFKQNYEIDVLFT